MLPTRARSLGISFGIHAAAVAVLAVLATERIRRDPPAPAALEIEILPAPAATVEAETEPAPPEEPEPLSVPIEPRPREVPRETRVAVVDEARPFQEGATEDGTRSAPDAEAIPAPTAPLVVDMSSTVGSQTDYVTTSSRDGAVPAAAHGAGAGSPGPTANQGAAGVKVARDWQITRLPIPLNDGDFEPAYPPAARREGREAVVALSLWVGADGRVTRVELAGDPDPHGFAEAARAYARKLRFSPARAGRHRVAARIDWTIHFYLRNQR